MRLHRIPANDLRAGHRYRPVDQVNRGKVFVVEEILQRSNEKHVFVRWVGIDKVAKFRREMWVLVERK